MRHDATAEESSFKKGQLVYLHIPNLLSKGTSKKLQPTYSGPYMIIRETSPVTVILRRLQDGHVANKSVHVSRLRSPLSKASARAILRRLETGPSATLFYPDVAPLRKKEIPPSIPKRGRGRPRKVTGRLKPAAAKMAVK